MRLYYMSLETHNINNVNTPMTLAVSNTFSVNPANQGDPSENTFGNYFQTCINGKQAYWGSNKPAPDICTPNLTSHSGVPCNSIWNNQTKRKGVVAYER